MTKIAFDFVCDEAPLFGKVGEIWSEQGAIVSGLVLGKRWQKWWRQFEVRQISDGQTYQEPQLDEELARIELDYGEFAPAWFPISDRFVSEIARDEQTRILVNTFQRVEAFFDHARPDAFFCTGIAYLYNLVTHAVCKRRGIPHASLYDIRQSKPRFTYSLGVDNCFDNVSRRFDDLMSLQAAERRKRLAADARKVEEFRSGETQPEYTKFAMNRSIGPVHLREFFIRFGHYYFEGWGRDPADYMTKSPFWYAKRDLTKTAKRFMQKLFSDRVFDPVAENDTFYLYPLPVQPEASTLILAPFNVDQVETISNVAKCLPLDAVLYVKEHPAQFGRRSFADLQRISRIHNVRLIAPWERTSELIRRSIGVICPSGTAAWEAMLHGKPSFLLGDVHFGIVDSRLRMKSYTDLRDSLHILYRREALNYNPEAVVAFYNALWEGSYEGRFTVAKMDTASMVLNGENVKLVHEGLRAIFENDLKSA